MKIISLFVLLVLIPVGSSLAEERQLEKGNALDEALDKASSFRRCCDDYESYVNGELVAWGWIINCQEYFGETIDLNNTGDMQMIKMACTNEIEKNLPEYSPDQRDDDPPVLQR